MEKDNFRDSNNKYMKIADVKAMNLAHLQPVELGMRPHAQNDVDRGKVLETKLCYYGGTSEAKNYDTLKYHERLVDGKPSKPAREIMLPIIDWIKPLREKSSDG